MENYLPSKGQKARRTLARLGILLSTLSIWGVLFSLGTALSFLGILAYYLILICILFLTMFTLLANEGFMSLFNGADLEKFIAFAKIVAPYVLYGTIACSFVSIILLSFDKTWEKTKTSRIVSIVTLVLGSLLLALYIFLQKSML